MIKSISPLEAAKSIESDKERFILIDVRSPAEFRNLHATYAINVPLEQIAKPESINLLRDKTVLCICQSGMRGRKAVETLLEEGLENVANVEGGTTLWSKSGLPVIKGSKTISIERQVRIAAGGLVFLGSILGIFISPLFLVIPVLIGAGLTFSGITDTCGMGLVLARCPWNL